MHNGTLLSWGNRNNPASTIPSHLKTTKFIDIATGPNYVFAIDETNNLHFWGVGHFGVDNIPTNARTDVIALDTGTTHVVALRTDGTVVAWGRNDYGQLNVPTNLSDVIAISAGGTYSMALKANGTISTWG
jgi:alpha-tubulin suppressor-like RCC1 family protein